MNADGVFWGVLSAGMGVLRGEASLKKFRVFAFGIVLHRYNLHLTQYTSNARACSLKNAT